jgi:23S rRNA pseudouridine2605 synthase
MYLFRYLQTEFGLARRKTLACLQKKSVLVNDVIVENLKHELQEWDLLTVTGIAKHFRVSFAAPESPKLIAFHKPTDYVCSHSDPHNKTIYDILPSELQHYHYIGRLDKDSTGLVLLTNQQNLVHTWTHPSHGIEKHYDVVLHKSFALSDVDRCLEWISDDGDILRVKSLQCRGKKVHIVLSEGKNRHIRRMMSALHYHVDSLCRVAEWSVNLDDLAVWSWRDVSYVLDSDVTKKS